MSSALAIQHRSPAAHCHICGLVGGGIFLIMKKNKKGAAAGGGQAQGGVALSAPVAAAVDTKI